MRLFDMLEMFLFDNSPHRLTDVINMSGEEYAAKKAIEAAIKTTIEDAISYGMEKEFILTKVNQKYGISKDEAEEIYENCLVVEV